MVHILFRNRAVLGILTLVGAAGLQAMTPASQPMMRMKPVAVGEKAPGLSLETLDGKKVELTELVKSGPVVVVELRGWVGYQCPICTQQVNELVTKAEEIKKGGTCVVLVYPGPKEGLMEHAKEFVAGKGLPEDYLFVVDPDMKFVNTWGLRWKKQGETAYPSTFVVDKEGTVKFAKTSTSHGGRASAAEIVKALTELK